jgi:hypothetical protein
VESRTALRGTAFSNTIVPPAVKAKPATNQSSTCETLSMSTLALYESSIDLTNDTSCEVAQYNARDVALLISGQVDFQDRRNGHSCEGALAVTGTDHEIIRRRFKVQNERLFLK